MAGLRKGKCYSHVTRAYTRKSKFKKKGFIKTIPPSKIVKFEMGELKRPFGYRVDLISKDRIQIRQNALESVRMLVNKRLHDSVGGLNYRFKVNVYPHHVLRENKMLTGAHADRMQTGMQKAFGTPVGLAAQVHKGQALLSAYVDKQHIELAKKALQLATPRIPATCSLDVHAVS